MPPKGKEKAKIPLPPTVISSDPITSNNSTKPSTSTQLVLAANNQHRKRSSTTSIYTQEPTQKSVKDSGPFNISKYATSESYDSRSLIRLSTQTRPILEHFGLLDELSEEEEKEEEKEENAFVSSIISQVTLVFII
jgi:hypothetical protein